MFVAESMTVLVVRAKQRKASWCVVLYSTAFLWRVNRSLEQSECNKWPTYARWRINSVMVVVVSLFLFLAITKNNTRKIFESWNLFCAALKGNTYSNENTEINYLILFTFLFFPWIPLLPENPDPMRTAFCRSWPKVTSTGKIFLLALRDEKKSYLFFILGHFCSHFTVKGKKVTFFWLANSSRKKSYAWMPFLVKTYFLLPKHSNAHFYFWLLLIVVLSPWETPHHVRLRFC